ncbi:MAG: prepilin peptidase [Candidatus Nealsonbacteria bacterium CG08_land_8_20_14_0_20_36_22]|uniref:Prepilin leader peptidase/N-methyltransferase n=1 Tax=Candidatus Nealsonbacteria bacterium CG08_land_8_20_14_0_20_36_22 TaxID=1974704 RepID=A0A2H0YNP7_9BACT|nr:MAG: prepilin peptidase [Candidatus Nealsonbacteria bacterium CG08_land_8_20_14_0_20_36_22]
MISVIIFLTGLAVGSFLNCVIYRLAIPRGRSFCPFCKHRLSWQDLIPVLSFFILRGKCRYCRKKISLQYPLVEIATGLLFLLIFNFQFSIFNFIIACFLITIFVYDLKHFIIPDKIIFPAIIIALIFNFQFLISKQFSIFNYSILSAFGAAIFFLTIVLISRGKAMGIGDIKLAFFMGLFLGFPNILVALFLAFLIGAIIGVGLILAKRKTLKSEVPFGPFLVTGIFIALFWGEKMIGWYFDLFNLTI